MMNLNNNNRAHNIKRRSFFMYLAVSVFGIFSLSKLPFSLFKSRINNEIARKNRISVKPNPFAVKRGSGGVKNG
jgi:hypothetical protein